MKYHTNALRTLLAATTLFSLSTFSGCWVLEDLFHQGDDNVCASVYEYIEPGSSVTGYLSSENSTEGPLGNGSYQYGYSIYLNYEDTIYIQMGSSEFDAMVGIADESCYLLDYNDDAMDGEYYTTDSSLIFVAPYSGYYTVVAGSYITDATGSYTLSVQSSNVVSGCDSVVGSLEAGQSLSSTLDGMDSNQTPRGMDHYAEAYALNLVPGKTYELSMRSSDFDAYLMLESDCQLVVEDDDSLGDGNSYIQFYAEEGASYTVVATSYAGYATGNFTISLRELGAEQPDEDPDDEPDEEPTPGSQCSLSPDAGRLGEHSTVLGSLALSDNMNGCRYYDGYQVHLNAGDKVTTTVRSAFIDPVMSVVSEDCQLNLTNDDFVGLGSQLTFVAPSTGDYKVLVSSYDCAETGDYTLAFTSGPYFVASVSRLSESEAARMLDKGRPLSKVADLYKE